MAVVCQAKVNDTQGARNGDTPAYSCSCVAQSQGLPLEKSHSFLRQPPLLGTRNLGKCLCLRNCCFQASSLCYDHETWACVMKMRTWASSLKACIHAQEHCGAFPDGVI
eukprot:1144846-Pelagomonas_calceolata.AAC.4